MSKSVETVVGVLLDITMGDLVALPVGLVVGESVGEPVSTIVGVFDGYLLGLFVVDIGVGYMLGAIEGDDEGLELDPLVRTNEG